jgi:radical SAM superfamily enzyme YgiQ (UPF0313 family)
MHIKFINPRMNCRPVDTKLKFKLLPPQSLLLLAALTPEKHTCELADENIEDFFYHDNPDLVAISVYIATANRAYAIASHYRAKGIPVVMGGIHATCRPDEVQQYADSVVIGEADTIWPRLLEDLENGRLQPVYRNTSSVSLDQSPILKRNLCASRYYASVNAMRTSRGCPYTCKFCYQSAFYPERGVRHRTISHIIDEIKSMQSNHVLFLDDNLVGNKCFAKKLFVNLIPLGITWSGAATINIGQDTRLLQLAYESGCRSLFIGFESNSQANLRENTKFQNKAEFYDQMAENIHRQGIMINGSFIFGMDHDTPDVFEETVEWIVKHRIETATFHILTPYPGTRLFDELEQAGRIIDYNWDHYNTAHVVFQPKNMTPQELEGGYLWAYKTVYSWKNILRRVPEVASLRWPYWGFVLGYKKLAYLTNWLSTLGMFNSLFDVGTKLLLSHQTRKDSAYFRTKQSRTKERELLHPFNFS